MRRGGGGGGGRWCECSVVDHMDDCMFGPSVSVTAANQISTNTVTLSCLNYLISFSPFFLRHLIPPPSALASFLSPFFLSPCVAVTMNHLSLTHSLTHSLSHSLSLSVLSMKGLGELGPLPFPSSIPLSSSSSSPPPPPTSWLALAAVSLEDGKEKEQEEEEREGRKWRWGHAVRRISPSPSPSLLPGRRWAL